MEDHVDGDDEVRRVEALAATLLHVASAHRAAEAAIASRADMIQAARDFGASWDDLGRVMGMSRQAAHKRFGDHQVIRPSR